MKRHYLIFRNLVLIFTYTILNAFNSNAQVAQTFSYTGSMQTFTVPACVGNITVQAWGAEGWSGSNIAGRGGYAAGVLTVSAGQVLNIFVGGVGTVANGNLMPAGGGFNGGGNGQSNGGSNAVGGGGGASDIRIGGTALTDRRIVAGGGGGSTNNGGAYGGDGGGLNGANGGQHLAYHFGTGGTQVAGGNAGGVLGIGGSGTATMTPWNGGGGGGYYGGGTSTAHSGGGGGSSYIGGVSNGSTTPGVRSGNGLITFTFNFNGNGVVASATPSVICVGSSINLAASGMVSYTWNTGSNSASISDTPSVTTSYTVQGTNSVNCISSSVLTVTVSPGLPVLTVATSTNLTCLGKTVTLTASGALTYTWTGGVTNGMTYSPTATSSYTVTGGNGCGTSTAVTAVTVAPIPVTVTSSPTLICAGTPATLNAVAAATGYTWTPSQFNLVGSTAIVNPTVSTIYTVTVTDGTCSGTGTVSLAADPVPTINISASSSVVCVGSSVNMSASGGLNYTWTPGGSNSASVTVSPTTTTSYSVTGVNSFGCISGTTHIVLTNPSPFLNVIASSSLVCAGDPVTLIANGNANSYAWTNGPGTSSYIVNPTTTTSYTVVATSSNSCTTTKTISVNVFNPVITITASSLTVCSGGNVTLTASGADSYNWIDGPQAPVNLVTPTVTTIYTVSAVTVSDNINCTTTVTIQINVNPNPTVSAVASPTAFCRNESTTLTATGTNSFSWSTGASGAMITYTSNTTGTQNHTVTGTDANGCTGTAVVQIKINGCVGINEYKSNPQISVYPNPSKGEFTIQSNIETELKLVNELGQVIKIMKFSKSNNLEISVSGLSEGIYFIKGENNNRVWEKVVVLK